MTVLLEDLLGHKLSSRHLALGLVVNVPGTAKPLHLPIAALESCRIVYRYHIPSIWRWHIPIDFRQRHDSYLLHVVSANRRSDSGRDRHLLTVRERTWVARQSQRTWPDRGSWIVGVPRACHAKRSRCRLVYIRRLPGGPDGPRRVAERCRWKHLCPGAQTGHSPR